MTWSVLQSAGTTTATASTVAATYGSNLSSGSKLIALVANSGGGATGVSDGHSNNFSRLTRVGPVVTNNSDFDLWVLDTPSGDVGIKPTITASGLATNGAAIVILEVSGLAAGSTTAACYDGTAGTTSGFNNASSFSPTVPTYSSGSASEFLVNILLTDGDGGDSLSTAPSGYTAASGNVNASADSDIWVYYKNSTGGTETGTYTYAGGGEDWAVILVAFKLAAAAAPSLPVAQAPYSPPAAPVQIPPRVAYASAFAANAQLATGTGAALGPSVAIVADAGLATGTGAALGPVTAAVSVPPRAQAPYRPPAAPVQIPPQVIFAPPAGAAVTANAGLATGTGAALAPSVAIAANAQLATGTGAALGPQAVALVPVPAVQAPYRPAPPPVQIPPQVILAPPAVPGQANAQLATGTGAALGPSVAIVADAGLATGTGAALAASVSDGASAGLPSGTGTAQGPSTALTVTAAVATGTGAALAPGHGAGIGLATGAGAALTASLAIAADAAAATALGAALGATGAAVLPFTVGQLTASTAAAGAAAGTLTASTGAGTLTASTAPGAALTASTEP